MTPFILIGAGILGWLILDETRESKESEPPKESIENDENEDESEDET